MVAVPCWTTWPWGSRWLGPSWRQGWWWAAEQTGRGSASSSHRCQWCRRAGALAWARCCPGWWWRTAPAPSAARAQKTSRTSERKQTLPWERGDWWHRVTNMIDGWIHAISYVTDTFFCCVLLGWLYSAGMTVFCWDDCFLLGWPFSVGLTARAVNQSCFTSGKQRKTNYNKRWGFCFHSQMHACYLLGFMIFILLF